jgi:hypothetical protein
MAAKRKTKRARDEQSPTRDDLDEAQLDDVSGGMFPPASKGDGQSVSGPIDVCKTPVPIVGAVPQPYSSTASASGAKGGSKSVKQKNGTTAQKGTQAIEGTTALKASPTQF